MSIVTHGSLRAEEGVEKENAVSRENFYGPDNSQWMNAAGKKDKK